MEISIYRKKSSNINRISSTILRVFLHIFSILYNQNLVKCILKLIVCYTLKSKYFYLYYRIKSVFVHTSIWLIIMCVFFVVFL